MEIELGLKRWVVLNNLVQLLISAYNMPLE